MTANDGTWSFLQMTETTKLDFLTQMPYFIFLLMEIGQEVLLIGGLGSTRPNYGLLQLLIEKVRPILNFRLSPELKWN